MTGHSDRLNRELSVGDRVVYLKRSKESSSLERGVVVGATQCYLKLEVPHSYRNGEVETIKISPEKTVKEVSQ